MTLNYCLMLCRTTTDPKETVQPATPPPPPASCLYGARAKFLAGLGYPRGLGAEIIKTLQEFPSRIWVLDNSASMSIYDGCVFTPGSKWTRTCTRWKELQDTIRCHPSVLTTYHHPHHTHSPHRIHLTTPIIPITLSGSTWTLPRVCKLLVTWSC